MQFPLDVLIQMNDESMGNRHGSFWSHFLENSLSDSTVNRQEVGLEAPGAISFRFPYSNEFRIKRSYVCKLLESFPLDLFIRTNTKSIGNGLGSSWGHFLQMSLFKPIGSQWEISLEAFGIIFFIKTCSPKLMEGQSEIGLEAPGASSFRFAY